MVNSNEFRIGNWVNKNNPVKIDVIHEWDEFDPIPMTTECLLATGMTLGHSGTYGYLFGYALELYDGVWEIEIGGSSDSERNKWVKLPFIHTLQNIWFALNLEEIDIKW